MPACELRSLEKAFCAVIVTEELAVAGEAAVIVAEIDL